MKQHHILVIIAVGLALVLSGCNAAAPNASSDAATAIPPIRAGNNVLVEGRIVPAREAALSLGTGGKLTQVTVAEGDTVSAGQLLLRVDDAQYVTAVHQAEAALAAAEANLANLEAGARSEEIAAADAAVAAAEASLLVVQAQVESARAGSAQAKAQIEQAQAALADLKAGATAEEIEIAQINIKRAENQLWAAQTTRDGVGGAVDRGHAQDYDLDNAEANIGIAYEGLRIARLELQRLERGPRAGAVAQSEAAIRIAEAGEESVAAQVAVSEAQVESAKAAIDQAKANANLTRAGARLGDLDAAKAAIDQAKASLEAALIAVEELALYAPFDGTVVQIDIEEGERVAPLTPLVHLADLSTWEIETDDLTEIDVVKIAVGQSAAITPDALSDLELTGTVIAIDNLYEEKLGDVTYTVRLRLNESDPRLRWGMTVEVRFDE